MARAKLLVVTAAVSSCLLSLVVQGAGGCCGFSAIHSANAPSTASSHPLQPG